MEKQTIGQFLSALRRSNGYTQQEVAEKLGVSNKTVSCWERDASYPDISMIPAIAELYGVTCDEILRAKRSPVQSETEHNEKQRVNIEKAEKEASAIFDNMIARYENSQKIAVASAVFVAATAVCIAMLTLALTNYIISAFAIAVTVSIAAFFALFMICYRIDFAVPSDERTFEVRKRMYLRKHRAFAFILTIAAFFAPFCLDFEYNSRYFAAGAACAVFVLMCFFAFRKAQKYAHPEYYADCDRDFTKKDFKAYTLIFSAATLATVVFAIVVRIIPYGDISYYSTVSDSVTLEGLNVMLGSSDIPEEYTLSSSQQGEQYVKCVYTVAKSDYDRRDLEGYVYYQVTGGVLDSKYTVTVYYPVWKLDYDYVDPLTGEIEKRTAKITVYNRHYLYSDIIQNGENTFFFSSSDLSRYYQNKRSRDFQYSSNFAICAVIFTFIAYGTWHEIAKDRFEKSKKKAAENKSISKPDDTGQK